jgi:hypothetical protein
VVGFEEGQLTMYHALGRDKPWQRNNLLSTSGRPQDFLKTSFIGKNKNYLLYFYRYGN